MRTSTGCTPGCCLKSSFGNATGTEVYTAEHKDRRVPGDLHILLSEQLLEKGDRPEGRKAHGP